MMFWELVAHIVVLGYWLGSELVINSTYRYVCYRDEMAFDERTLLMEHVMCVDQHVRYALVLQAGLGVMLCVRFGFIPGGQTLYFSGAAVMVFWLVFVEAVHRLRNHAIGQHLAAIDRLTRYLLLIVLLGVAAGLIGGAWPLPAWLKWKLALFAGVMACGIGIRFALITHFRTWAEMASSGVSATGNAAIKRTYIRATSVLVLLWIFIAGIAALSVMKPA